MHFDPTTLVRLKQPDSVAQSDKLSVYQDMSACSMVVHVLIYMRPVLLSDEGKIVLLDT